MNACSYIQKLEQTILPSLSNNSPFQSPKEYSNIQSKSVSSKNLIKSDSNKMKTNKFARYIRKQKVSCARAHELAIVFEQDSLKNFELNRDAMQHDPKTSPSAHLSHYKGTTKSSLQYRSKSGEDTKHIDNISYFTNVDDKESSKKHFVVATTGIFHSEKTLKKTNNVTNFGYNEGRNILFQTNDVFFGKDAEDKRYEDISRARAQELAIAFEQDESKNFALNKKAFIYLW